MTYVIIGNGTAGIAAALSLRKHDKEGRIIILSDEEMPYYSRPLIVDVMTGKRSRNDLILLSPEEYLLQGLELRKPVTVKQLSISAKEVETSAGPISYDKLLIASGATPKGLPFGGSGVFYLRSVDDAEAIHQALRTGAKRVLIYGAGPVGVKAACALVEARVPVSFVVTSQRILSRVFDQKAALHFQRLFEARGVRFHMGRQVNSVIRKRGFRGIITDKGEEIAGDLLIAGKGVLPHVTFAAHAGIQADEGIFVNDRMETSAEGVYAAGDAARAPMAGGTEKEVTAIWPLAQAQGKVAGANMAGQAREYAGSVGSNSLECFGTRAISLGVVEGEGFEETVVEDEDLYRKYVFDGERLVGAVLVNNIQGAGILLDAVRKGLALKGHPFLYNFGRSVDETKAEVLF